MLGFGKKNAWKKNTGYMDFQTEKEYKTPLFYTIMEQCRPKKDIFMLLADKTRADAEGLKQLAADAAKKGYQVYAPKEFHGMLGDNVCYVEVEQQDGIEALLTAGVVYTDGRLPFQYVKQPGQTVIFDRSCLDEHAISDRIKRSMAQNRADAVRVLQNGTWEKADTTQGTKQKKKILVFLNMLNFEVMYTNFHKMTGYIDFDKYEVTLCFLNKYFKQYEEILARLDPRICLISRQGGLFCEKETARRMDYLDTLGEEDAEREAKYLIDPSVFEREAGRIFGDTKFDYIFNMKFDSLYWKMLIQELEGKRIYFEPSDLENLSDQKKNEKSRIYEFYDSIVCLNEGQLRQCRMLVADPQKCRLLPYMEHKVPLLKERYEKSMFEDGKSYIAAPVKKDVDFDRITIQRIPVEEPPAKFCVLDSGMDKESAADFLREQAGAGQKLYVFDFYRLLSQEDLEQLPNGGKLCLFHEADIYEGITPYLGEEIPVPRACECKEGQDLMSYFLPL